MAEWCRTHGDDVLVVFDGRPQAHLEELAGALREGEYWIILDEIYGELVYDGFQQHSLLEVAPDPGLELAQPGAVRLGRAAQELGELLELGAAGADLLG